MTHIVDTLINERSEKLQARPMLWRLVQKFLYPIMGYAEAIQLIDEVQGFGGVATFEHVSMLLKLDVSVEGIEHLPKDGRAVLMPNHPTGIADGIAVYDAVKNTRPDMAIFANRDAVRCQPLLDEIIIPVEWMEEKRNHAKSKEMVRNMIGAFRNERLVVIFASGRLARPTPLGLVERPWLASGVGLAQKYNCPIIPMHIRGFNSTLYYLLWFLNAELKDMTLFRELVNKTNQRYEIRIGRAVHSTQDPEILSSELRRYVIGPLRKGETDYPG
jgi:putative hemolysin